MEETQNEIIYLEDISESAEFVFALSKVELTDRLNFVSYFEAFNTVGQRLFRAEWTNREFFANKVSNQCEEFKNKRKLSYAIFKDIFDENQAHIRADATNLYLLNGLRSGALVASYFQHSAGTLEAFPQEFWSTLKSTNARSFGRFRPSDLVETRCLPGLDYLVVIPIKQIKSFLKTAPRNTAKARLRPSLAAIKQAVSILEAECKATNTVLNRPLFCAALNHLFQTDHFKETSGRAHWQTFTSRNKPGIKNPSFLNYRSLPPIEA